MWNWLRRYHNALIRRGTASEGLARHSEVYRIARPWLLALVGAMVSGVVLESITVPAVARVAFAGAMFVGVLALIGMTYAMLVYVIAGTRADHRRNRGG